jgi:hypothetical protein
MASNRAGMKMCNSFCRRQVVMELQELASFLFYKAVSMCSTRKGVWVSSSWQLGIARRQGIFRAFAPKLHIAVPPSPVLDGGVYQLVDGLLRSHVTKIFMG